MAKAPSKTEAMLLIALTNKTEQYGLELRDSVQERFGKEIPLGSLYVTLQRMEKAGYIRTRKADPKAERGDRRRQYFKITGDGERARQAFELLNPTGTRAGANHGS